MKVLIPSATPLEVCHPYCAGYRNEGTDGSVEDVSSARCSIYDPHPWVQQRIRRFWGYL